MNIAIEKKLTNINMAIINGKRQFKSEVADMKQLLFVHCAGSQSPGKGSGPLLAYLQSELAKEYELHAPLMPNPENPSYAAWKEALRKEFALLRDGVVLVGHSLGGSVLLKMFAEQKISVKAAGLLLLAAPKWGADEDWQSEEYALPQSIAAISPVLPKVILYHSKDDPVVSFRHAELYLQDIPGAELRTFMDKGHYFQRPNASLPEDIRSLGSA